MLIDKEELIQSVNCCMSPTIDLAMSRLTEDYPAQLEREYDDQKNELTSQFNLLRQQEVLFFRFFIGLNLLFGSSYIYLSNKLEVDLFAPIDNTIVLAAIVVCDILLLFCFYLFFGPQDSRIVSFRELYKNNSTNTAPLNESLRAHRLSVLKSKWVVLHRVYYSQQKMASRVRVVMAILLLLTLSVVIFLVKNSICFEV